MSADSSSSEDSFGGRGQLDQHFTIRMWLEMDSSEEKKHSWRGKVRHANSGEEREFIGFDRLFGFIRDRAEAWIQQWNGQNK